jgi:hypothetical protein
MVLTKASALVSTQLCRTRIDEVRTFSSDWPRILQSRDGSAILQINNIYVDYKNFYFGVLSFSIRL